jgi:hypothetical protein
MAFNVSVFEMTGENTISPTPLLSTNQNRRNVTAANAGFRAGVPALDPTVVYLRPGRYFVSMSRTTAGTGTEGATALRTLSDNSGENGGTTNRTYQRNGNNLVHLNNWGTMMLRLSIPEEDPSIAAPTFAETPVTTIRADRATISWTAHPVTALRHYRLVVVEKATGKHVFGTFGTTTSATPTGLTPETEYTAHLFVTTQGSGTIAPMASVPVRSPLASVDFTTPKLINYDVEPTFIHLSGFTAAASDTLYDRGISNVWGMIVNRSTNRALVATDTIPARLIVDGPGGVQQIRDTFYRGLTYVPLTGTSASGVTPTFQNLDFTPHGEYTLTYILRWDLDEVRANDTIRRTFWNVPNRWDIEATTITLAGIGNAAEIGYDMLTTTVTLAATNRSTSALVATDTIYKTLIVEGPNGTVVRNRTTTGNLAIGSSRSTSLSGVDAVDFSEFGTYDMTFITTFSNSALGKIDANPANDTVRRRIINAPNVWDVSPIGISVGTGSVTMPNGTLAFNLPNNAPFRDSVRNLSTSALTANDTIWRKLIIDGPTGYFEREAFTRGSTIIVGANPVYSWGNFDFSEFGDYNITVVATLRTPTKTDADITNDTLRTTIFNRNADVGPVGFMIGGVPVVDGGNYTNFGNEEEMTIQVENFGTGPVGGAYRPIFSRVWIDGTSVVHNGANPTQIMMGDTIQPGEVKDFTFTQTGNFLPAVPGEPTTFNIMAIARTATAAANTFDNNQSNDTIRLTITNTSLKDLQATGIYSPETGIGLTATEQVIVGVKNNGTWIADNATITLFVHGVEVAEENLPVLNPGDSIGYVFTHTLDLTTIGDYYLEVVINYDGDQIPENNEAHREVHSYSAPVNDVAILAITSPVSGEALSNAENVTVIVRNNSTIPVINVPITYIINDGTPVTEFISALDLDEELIFTFATKADLSVADTYNFVVFIDFNDDFPENDTVRTTVVFREIIVKINEHDKIVSICNRKIRLCSKCKYKFLIKV